jgi:hypothetical protein
MDKYISFIKNMTARLGRIRLGMTALALMAVVVFLLLVLAHAPARLASLANQTHIMLLDNFQGSIWDGTARSSAVQLRGKWLPLGKVDWQLRQLRLLVGSLDIRAQTQNRFIESNLNIVARNKQIRINSGQAFIDLKAIQSWLPSAFKMRGNLSIKINEFTYHQEVKRLSATLFSESLSAHAFGKEYQLGSFIAEAAKTESAFRFSISNSEDALLQTSGIIDYHPGESIYLDLAIKPGDQASKETRGMLKDLGGIADQKGFHHLKFRHRL